MRDAVQPLRISDVTGSTPIVAIKREQRAQIIHALKINSNARAVARDIGGVGHATVSKIAREEGIELTAGKAVTGRPRISAEKRTHIIDALKINSNASAVALDIGGVSYSTVSKIAREEGISLTAGKAAKNGAAAVREIGDVSISRVRSVAKQACAELTACKASPGRQVPAEKHAFVDVARKVSSKLTARKTRENLDSKATMLMTTLAKARPDERAALLKIAPTEVIERVLARLRQKPRIPSPS